MKHLLFIAFSLFGLTILLKAQENAPYLPTAIEGANWIIRDNEAHQGPYISFVDSVEGDTMVAGQTYKKVYRRVIDHIQEVHTDPPLTRPYHVFPERELILLLRDEVEERQVFGRIRTLNPDEITFRPDTLLHDYSQEEGDTVRGVNFEDFGAPWIIDEVRYETHFGVERRVQIIGGEKYYEGVGAQSYGPVSAPPLLVACCIKELRDYCVGNLEDCQVWLTPVSNLEPEVSIKAHPNPFTTQLNFTPSENQFAAPVQVTLRDVTGRLLKEGMLENGLQWTTDNLASGVYIATFTSGAQRGTVRLLKQ